jgi:hypothetical protein
VLKTLLIALACSATTATAVLVYVGRTVHSAPFQLDIPYGSALKTTVDPANVWSWHHQFANTTNTPVTADVLVDFDSNNVMDTEYSWLRVMVTDLELVGDGQIQVGGFAIARILDGTGRRLAVGLGAYSASGPVHHVSLTSPIVLPVGSPLRVELTTWNAPGTYEVHLIGRVVSL